MKNYSTADPDKSSVKKWWRMYITPMGNLADVSSINFTPRQHIKKISKNEYVVIQSGEVKQMQEHNERNKRSLRKISKELRQTITANFYDLDDKKLFVTLTYAENMQDEKRLYDDFKAFYKRLKRYVLPQGHNLEYIVVMEPQGRGAWHAHLLLKSDKTLFIHHADMQRIWGHGATRTERLHGIDNIGAYFIGYFNSVEITPENQEKYHVDDNDIIEKDGKKYIKGERLKHYPDYMQIWRHSRGIEKPKAQKTHKKAVLEDYEPPHVTHKYEIETVKPEAEQSEALDPRVLTIVNTQHRKKK